MEIHFENLFFLTNPKFKLDQTAHIAMDYRDMLNTAVFTLKPVDTIYKTLHTLYQCAGLHVVLSLLIYFMHTALFSVTHTQTHTHTRTLMDANAL